MQADAKSSCEQQHCTWGNAALQPQCHFIHAFIAPVPKQFESGIHTHVCHTPALSKHKQMCRLQAMMQGQFQQAVLALLTPLTKPCRVLSANFGIAVGAELAAELRDAARRP